MSDNSNSNSNSGIYTIIIALLLLLSAGMGYFLWNKSKGYREESEAKQLDITRLTKEKDAITRSLDSLTLAYADLRTENESLTSRVASTAGLVQQKEGQIRNIKIQLTKDLDGLRAQVAELQKTKTELETIIGVLRAENAQLKAENQRLTGENEQLKTDKAQLTTKADDLAKQLEEQIKKTHSATFKASSFKVEVERRGDRVTGKAKKAREVMVSFDMVDVPQSFQGAQTLYLVITDDKGNPINASNPTKTTIKAPAGAIEIIAQQTKAVDLGNTQRIAFTHKLEDKLKSGNYVVAIYCEKGLLGASSFRLS